MLEVGGNLQCKCYRVEVDKLEQVVHPLWYTTGRGHSGVDLSPLSSDWRYYFSKIDQLHYDLPKYVEEAKKDDS